MKLLIAMIDLTLLQMSTSLPHPSIETRALDCMGGGVGGHSSLPFCLPIMYSRLSPPQGAWVSTVYVEPVILGDIGLDDILGHFSFNMKLSIYWQDFRLIIRPDLNRTDWFHVSYRASEELWMPEINLLDLVNVVMLDLTKDGGELRVRGDKTFSLTYQMRVKIRCKLDLKLFPHDYQTCHLLLSLPMTHPSVILQLFQTSLPFPPDPQFDLLSAQPLDLTDMTQNANCSQAGFSLQLKRKVLSHLVYHYLPAGLMVMSSLLSLMVPLTVNMASVRIGLIALPGVMIAQIARSVKSQLPFHLCPTFLEVYLASLVLLVFLLLLQTSLLLLRRRVSRSFRADMTSISDTSDCSNRSQTSLVWLEGDSSFYRCVDFYTAICYLGLFGVLNFAAFIVINS